MCRSLFFLMAMMFAGCQLNDANSPSETSASQTGERPPATSRLDQTDSLQVLYYDDPNGDSLRYSRFYRFISLSDSTTINQLLKNLKQPFETLPEKKDCRSDGKIYAYSKNEVVKTIYFNTTSSNCYYLYYIQDGAFVYFKLDKALQTMLRDHKENAVAPQPSSNDSL